MKKIILATLLIGMMGGCTKPTIVAKNTNYTIPIRNGYATQPLTVCVIEGCQYFICDINQYATLTHKGNCSNPIHKGGNK
jgi:hypothetical protein